MPPAPPRFLIGPGLDVRRQLDNVIEFLFFLTLVWCAQKMLSHAIGTHLSQTVPHSSNRPPPAFAFHRTAFKERIDALVAATKADEVMITTMVFDHAARKRSYELIAKAYGLTVGATTAAA